MSLGVCAMGAFNIAAFTGSFYTVFQVIASHLEIGCYRIKYVGTPISIDLLW